MFHLSFLPLFNTLFKQYNVAKVMLCQFRLKNLLPLLDPKRSQKDLKPYREEEESKDSGEPSVSVIFTNGPDLSMSHIGKSRPILSTDACRPADITWRKQLPI